MGKRGKGGPCVCVCVRKRGSAGRKEDEAEGVFSICFLAECILFVWGHHAGQHVCFWMRLFHHLDYYLLQNAAFVLIYSTFEQAVCTQSCSICRNTDWKFTISSHSTKRCKHHHTLLSVCWFLAGLWPEPTGSWLTEGELQSLSDSRSTPFQKKFRLNAVKPEIVSFI